jgi:hypothetical protein
MAFTPFFVSFLSHSTTTPLSVPGGGLGWWFAVLPTAPFDRQFLYLAVCHLHVLGPPESEIPFAANHIAKYTPLPRTGQDRVVIVGSTFFLGELIIDPHFVPRRTRILPLKIKDIPTRAAS